jgi:hypothetical protein
LLSEVQESRPAALALVRSIGTTSRSFLFFPGPFATIQIMHMDGLIC